MPYYKDFKINWLPFTAILSEKNCKWFIQLSSEVKLPQFKVLAIVHKEGNPGRLVVSSIDCHTTKISK